MAIDFTLPPDIEELRLRVRAFISDVVAPEEAEIERLKETDRKAYVGKLIALRKQAHAEGLWMPHMPKEWGGMALGHVGNAMVQAEAAKSYYGPWVLNAQAPDEGNMHTLEHWGTDEQKEKYLRPLCEGKTASCFAMTEPEVAGSDRPATGRPTGDADRPLEAASPAARPSWRADQRLRPPERRSRRSIGRLTGTQARVTSKAARGPRPDDVTAALSMRTAVGVAK